ncbi:MAG TPA: PEP/pyruvate-binding domain-containing protein [Cytophagaceae bacterium]|jgi:pyruvate,water dikinase
MKFISHEEANPGSEYTLGGKASNLLRLKRLGIKVPNWIVIPKEVLEDIFIIEPSNDDHHSDLFQKISSIKIPDLFIEQVVGHFPDTRFFAVRSSAADEDGSEYSFAGQYDSFLYVIKETLEESIKKVWCSSFSDRVAQYRHKNNLTQKFGISVIVQRMIDAEAAGVAFSINPVNGDRNEKIISAVYGLGEGLVSGELNADNFAIKDQIVTERLADKTHRVILDIAQNSGTRTITVEEEKRKVACLSSGAISEIVRLLEVCEKEYQKPIDIEFAVMKDAVYCLQARPVTSISKPIESGEDYIVWDNSNIIESYPGVTSPLTFSFIIKMYEAVYRQFADIMGVSSKDVDENSHVFANMLGLLNGRVYYNLFNWYKALALLPGYSLNAEFMEKMMGVKERFVLKDVKKRTRFSERLRVLNLIRIMLKNLTSLPKMRVVFQKDFNKTMEVYEKIKFEKCRPEELMQLYNTFEQTLLKKWKAPLVNDFFAMIYFGVLQKLVVRYKISDDAAISNDLLCGAKDIVSTEPIRRLLTIADAISKNPDARELFLLKKENEILQQLSNKAFEEIKNHIDSYLKVFGERCVGELKLETVTYKQNPSAFIKIVKSYVQQGIVKNTDENKTEDHLRDAAEKKARKALEGKWSRRLVFNYFLKHARTLVSQRENLRFERTRGFGMVRQIFSAIGHQFYTAKLINSDRDIFFLTKKEVFDYIKGTSVNKDLRKLILQRKEEYSVFEKQKTAERIRTNGIVNYGNDFSAIPAKSINDGDLKGIGCCAGVVRAKVRLVVDPNEVENLNGDILVTSSTDPGWVTLFPTAAGILVERGSLLSHSAIVSREMGIPCIVGITGLLDLLRSGDLVEMDGRTGEIKILDRHE